MSSIKSRIEDPLERVTRFGLRSVSSIDLLAIAICQTPDQIQKRECTAREWLSQRSIHHINAIGSSDLVELNQLESFEATRILAAIELGRRAGNAGPGPVEHISSSEDVVRLFSHLREEKKEYFCAIFLSAKNTIIALRTIHIGTVNSSIIGPREIFREAIREGAASLILVHNHPSGDPTPSADDIQMTRTLTQIGKMLDILLLDHVIIGHHQHISLNKEGLLLS